MEVPVAPAQAINQGDMVFAGADSLTLPVSAGSGLLFLGVAEDTNPVTSLGDRLSQITVIRRGTFRFKTTAGENYTPYQAVYGGATAQTVSNVSSSKTLVGYVSPNQAGLTGGFPIAGGTGVEVDVIIKPIHPDSAV